MVRIGMARIGMVALALAATSGACSSEAPPPEQALAAVVRAVPDGLPHEDDGPTVTDVEVVETARLALKASEPETWCVAVVAVASEVGHWLDGRSIWLAIEDDDGTWRATPTFLNAVHIGWEDRCGFGDSGSG